MIWVVHPGSGSRIGIMIFYPSLIPDPGVKKDNGSGSATLQFSTKNSDCQQQNIVFIVFRANTVDRVYKNAIVFSHLLALIICIL
jgi:hypothetical protein